MFKGKNIFRLMFVALIAIVLVFSTLGQVFAKSDWVYICHVPPGNPENMKIHEVSRNAWENGHSPHNMHALDFLVSGPNDPSCGGASATATGNPPTATRTPIQVTIPANTATSLPAKTATATPVIKPSATPVYTQTPPSPYPSSKPGGENKEKDVLQEYTCNLREGHVAFLPAVNVEYEFTANGQKFIVKALLGSATANKLTLVNNGLCFDVQVQFPTLSQTYTYVVKYPDGTVLAILENGLKVYKP